jgi:uncharacterized membrane protein
MRANLIAYGTTAVIFFALDFVWLSLTMKPLYQARLGTLLLAKPNFPVAALFYLAYVVGIVVFAVIPALADGNWMRALWGGALLGLVAYGTYDMTNLATVSGWSTLVTIVDLAWGTVATAAAAVAGYYCVTAIAGS